MKAEIARKWVVLALAAGLPLAAQAQTYSRTEAITYYDDTAHWVLGQVAQTRCVAPTAALPAGCGASGTVIDETTYDATTALPLTVKSYGKLQKTFTYDTTSAISTGQRGTLKTVKDGNNNVTTLSGWKGGIPQSIHFPITPESPSGATRSAVVDGNGWITSVTDEAGNTTGYGYDGMGRINQITYPTGDTVAWANTTSTFVQVNSAEVGIAAGHWKQTVTTGNAKKVTYFDALWRPVLTWEYDAANSAATSRYVAAVYDTAGRVVDVSYPLPAAPMQASDGTWVYLAARPAGTRTTYDALDRPTSVVQDAEAPWGTVTTTTQYLAGLQTRVTNPRGNITTTSYQAWDSPSTDLPVAIASPEGVYTDIARDVFGKPTAITRRNSGGTVSLTRSLVYDAYQQLCKTVEPETGATVMAYDPAGNLDWSASGLTLTSTASCDTASVPAGSKVDRSYDARARLTTLSFPDGKGSQAWTYTPDGLPATIETANDTPADIVANGYSYNKRRLPSQETLTVPGQSVLTLGYGYSNTGALASLTYPDGEALAYVPNALGQPTKAGSYATGVSYFRNGAMQGFTYGNGIVHTLVQNARGLPERSTDSGGVLDDSYDYDKNANVAAISDGLSGNRGDRTMTYDGLDRLTDTVSPMFDPAGAHYSYDVLDNLTHVIAPGRDHWYCYDTRWQLTNVKTTSCSGTSVIGLGYDERGNLQNKNGQLYAFDYGNRLRSATGLETYRYDGQGRRASASSAAGAVYSFYGQDGALRYQRDERQGKAFNYISLNGSLLARKSTTVTVPTAPAVPTLTVPSTSSTGSYTASWATSSGATHYELSEQVGSGSWTVIQDTSATSKAISGKTDGSYSYRVRACNGAGTAYCSGYSTTKTITVTLPVTPVVPTLTLPTTSSTGSYTASWTVSSGATHYELSEQVGSGSWAVIQDTSATSRAVSGKTNGSYSYRVRACNGTGTTNCSAYSTTKTITVSLPSIPVVPTLTLPTTSTTGSYTASWTTSSGATHYELSEQVGSGSWTVIQDTSATSKAISGKTDGSYSYRVRACNGTGTTYCSGYSTTKTIAVTLPVTPVAPTLTLPTTSSTGSYTASWTTSSGATHYELSEQVGSGSWTVIQDTSATSKAISGKTDGTYSYRVRACNGTGTANCSAYSTTKTITVALPVIPLEPTLTLPSTSSTGSYTVSWTASSGATHYELSEQVDSGSWTVIQDTSATSRAVSGKTDGTYGYRVRACNGAGTSYCSAYSTTKTIAVAIPVIPAVPTLTVPATSGTGSYTASWTTSSSATHYELSEQVGSGSWTVIQDTSATSKAISGKTNGTYSYRVRACNGTGTTNCSGYSTTKTITVSLVAIPATPILNGYAEEVLPKVYPRMFDFYLDWSAPTGATYYDLMQDTTIVYSGTALTYHAYGPSNLLFQVRACNTAGCSAWSPALNP